MPIEVTMPKLSPTMESGRLAEWKVKVGDQVREGDTLAEVETDKATMPMNSYDDGIVAHLDVAEGDEVALEQRILVLAQKGEDPKEVAKTFEGGSGGGGGAKPAPKAKPKAEPEPEDEPEEESEPKDKAKTKEKAADSAKAADSEEFEGGEVTNSPHRPDVSGDLDDGESNGQGVRTATGGRVKSSPLARKVAASEKVDLGRVHGSGPGGRVVRRDVEAFLEKRKQKQAAAPVSPAGRPAAATAPGKAAAPRRIPHTRMRKTIAKRMVEAKQQAPEIHVAVDVRLDKVMAIRESLNKQLAAEKVKLSVGDFITKAVALALRKHPNVNASFEPEAIVEHAEVNVGIAVALEGGLIVPVIHRADLLGLREIRQATEAVAEAARQGKLTGEQLTGATFTISNLGMYGVRQFDAILDLPQVGILAVGAGEKRPVVVGDKLEIGTVMTVNLTADHRAVDGASAAIFLQTLRGLLEEPASMLL